MSLCFSLQDAFTVFGEYTDLEWRANTDQIIFKLVALIWTLKDGDPKIRDYTTSTFFNPVLGNVIKLFFRQASVILKTPVTSRFDREKGYYSRLSLNGHLYKTDTSVKRTPRVGPCLSSLLLFDSP